MKLLAKCKKCGASVWRIYISRNIVECHECREVYNLSELCPVKVEHQR